MNSSSAQPSCSITSVDTIDLSSITTLTLPDPVTLDFGNMTGTSSTYIGGHGGGGTYTISIGNSTISGSGGGYAYGTGSGTVNIGPLTSSDISFTFQNDEWVHRFPDWNRIEKMCKEYPGLKAAFEKFKTTYNLVKDDYDTPPEKRIKP